MVEHYAVVAPYAPHPGKAHKMRVSDAERVLRGTADHPYRARCGLVVTSTWLGRTGPKFGWGINPWGKVAEYHTRCKKCWSEG